MTIETIFAFDFGVKRIGVAMGNTMIRQAEPVKVISAIDNATRFADIQALLDEWKPARLVVGLPMHPDGAEHEMTARARKFANQLHGRFSLPVELVDERYSSAVISAKRGEVIDDRAAAIILQQYFDTH
ncbi:MULTISPECIES: Holliday junction resolvase RuvX [Telluria group]|uniref:Putative pre-16S rRNA nuclease n=1 Tax=Rugamonas rivuli TaxID=2743358 RepID=A0A843SGR5_9BURK|nr:MULTISPECIES: Holliday junction resolvase RuvX [Telluria group]MQA21341.1 Holliday junction resolvase RuvX [Rugamonas rivuli]RFP12019.1 Holliday junction resolvase RuvX [Duganella sp. BJB475]RFP29970.1 Holliday junction resolvase RuvX [Duganella sp. BJB476]